MVNKKERQFILTLNYKSNVSDWDTISHDVINADDLVKLLSQFMIVIGSLHRRILEEELTDLGKVMDDDIPF